MSLYSFGDRRVGTMALVLSVAVAACAASVAPTATPQASSTATPSPSGDPSAAGATASTATPMAASALDRLAFMAGCWAEGEEGLREQFTAPTPNLILGTSRYVRGGRVVQFEFHTITADGDVAVLTPHPGGHASVPFRADSASDRYVAFGNPSHDFPQRIIYDGQEDDILVVAIEGPRDGATARSSWRMQRVTCPA